MVEHSRARKAQSGDIYISWGVLVSVGLFIMAIGAVSGYHQGWIVMPIISVIGVAYASWSSKRKELLTQSWASAVEGRLWLLVRRGGGCSPSVDR